MLRCAWRLLVSRRKHTNYAIQQMAMQAVWQIFLNLYEFKNDVYAMNLLVGTENQQDQLSGVAADAAAFGLCSAWLCLPGRY